ncbi:MAG TPA: hypothetical protein VGI47_01270 [Candidatus Binataceae bacterium]|jgi:hypothetical protein
MKLEAMLWTMVLISVAIAIVLPRYRTYSFGAVGVLIVAIVTTVVLARRDEPAKSSLPRAAVRSAVPEPQHIDFEQLHIENLDKKEPDAKSRIGLNEIRFDQIRPELGSDPGTIRLIRARLYNDSARYTLTDYAYYLAVQDCADSVCTTVYDQRGQAAASVPPHQAREVLIAIRDGDIRGVPTFKILGTPKVELTPTSTRAFASSL